MNSNTEINDGGPAFPSEAFDNVALPGCVAGPMRGMSLRDYYAGQALIGICANKGTFNTGWEHASICAYMAADAMIAERNK